jgi:hypothetical protein
VVLLLAAQPRCAEAATPDYGISEMSSTSKFSFFERAILGMQEIVGAQ